MANPKVSLAFLNAKVESKIKIGIGISEGLQANIDTFTNLPTTPADLLKKTQELQAADVEAAKGGKKEKYALKTVNKEWTDMYRDVANTANLAAKGNAKLIAAAGFMVANDGRTSSVTPDMVDGLKAKPGSGKGTCEVAGNSQKGMKAYMCLLADPNVTIMQNGDTLMITGGPVYIKLCGRKQATFDSLPSGKTLCATMVAFNSAGISPLAPGIEMIPQ